MSPVRGLARAKGASPVDLGEATSNGMGLTTEEKFWSSKFGKEYAKRNYRSNKELDDFYIQNLGVKRSQINKYFLGKLKINNILEVGCNVGNQLTMLQNQGFKNLYGIEVYDKAAELAKKTTTNINIIQASGFALPFKDNCFDLVFTSGVLIHTNPKRLKDLMAEIYRTSKKYIWGTEYYHPKHINADYRRNKNYLWKGDFAKMYLKYFPKLKLVKEEHYEKIKNNVWTSFLLKKI